MRSFALWYSVENEEQESDKEVTVNINIWDKRKDREKKYCFDFGLLIEDIRNIEKIYLYVPLKIEKHQIRDLGGLISNNKLVNAIFNEDYTTTAGEPKRLIVNGNQEKESFVIYALEVENQIILKNCLRDAPIPGTVLEIRTQGIEPGELVRYYFRIRIEIKACSENLHLINNKVEGISIFSNQFTNTEIIDFRLNDVRSCSEELREQFDKGNKFNILAVHYLILRSANDVIIHYGKNMSSRILEKDLWKTYIDGCDQNIIAYHIKSKADVYFDSESECYKVRKYVENFTDLSRFQYKKGTKKIIAGYVTGIVVLGALGGILGNLISKLIGL